MLDHESSPALVFRYVISKKKGVIGIRLGKVLNQSQNFPKIIKDYPKSGPKHSTAAVYRAQKSKNKDLALFELARK